METWLSALLGGIGVALVGVLGNIVIQWIQRRNRQAEAGKTEAEESDLISQAAVRLADRWESQVTKLEKRVTELEAALAERDKRISTLDAEVAGLQLRVRQLSETNARQSVEIARLREHMGDAA